MGVALGRVRSASYALTPRRERGCGLVARLGAPPRPTLRRAPSSGLTLVPTYRRGVNGSARWLHSSMRVGDRRSTGPLIPGAEHGALGYAGVRRPGGVSCEVPAHPQSGLCRTDLPRSTGRPSAAEMPRLSPCQSSSAVVSERVRQGATLRLPRSSVRDGERTSPTVLR